MGWQGTWRTAATLLMLVAAAFFSVRPARAEGINLMADMEYQQSKSTMTNLATNVAIDSDYTRLSQLYFVDVLKEFSPNLLFRTGGNFERNDISTRYAGGAETESTDRAVQPYAEFNLSTPMYTAGTSYRQVELQETASAGAAPVKNYMASHAAMFNWKPSDLPRLHLSFTRNTSHDEPLTTDAANQLFSLGSKYSYRQLQANYQYSRQEVREMLLDTGSQTDNHNGGLRYSSDFFDNRLLASGGVRLNQTAIQFSGAGENRLQTTNLGTLFYLLDDPVPTGNAVGDFTSVDAAHPITNVNIGRNGGLHQVSAALDFGGKTELDTVYVLIKEDNKNPDLATPSQISSVAGSLVWRLFVSDDQEVWTERTVTSAKYNIFDNRFELAFTPGVDTRFVKVVTTPLNLAAPGEIRFADLQAYTTVTGNSGQRLTSQVQNYNFGLQWKVSDKTSSGYDAYYRAADSKPAGSGKTAMTHSAFFRHIFSPIFVGNARLLRSEVSQTNKGKDLSHTLTASLAGNYLETFSQALTYSGTTASADQGDSSTHSLFLRNRADLYQGWSATLDFGNSWKEVEPGGRASNLFVRTGTSVIPNKTMHFNLGYQVDLATAADRPDSQNQSGSFQAYWVPLSTLSMMAELRFNDKRGALVDSTVAQSYSVSWSPFVEGDLQFGLSFSQSQNTEEDRTRFLTPFLRWAVANGVLASLDYSTGTTDSSEQSSDFDSITANLRVQY